MQRKTSTSTMGPTFTGRARVSTASDNPTRPTIRGSAEFGERPSFIAPLRRCHIVLTTMNKQQLDSLVGCDTGAIEIVGKPYDLTAIADAVERGPENHATGDVRESKGQDEHLRA